MTTAEYSRRYKEAHPDRSRAERLFRLSRPLERAKQLLRDAKHRANKVGREFSLTIEWVQERILLPCALTGLPFVFKHTLGRNPFSPSIDRIDSLLGYTPDNCRLILFTVNSARGEWSDDVLAVWARAFLKQYDSAH